MLHACAVLLHPGVQTVWKFDKREFGGKAPPRNLPPPPENVNNNLVRLIVAMVNEATDNIPCWDDYVATGGCTVELGGGRGREGGRGELGGRTTTQPVALGYR